jgi:urease accessory protein
VSGPAGSSCWDEHLPGLPCVYVITTSGCLLQGDRLDVSITVGADAMAHVTTQSATKIHQMDAGVAAQSQHVALGEHVRRSGRSGISSGAR